VLSLLLLSPRFCPPKSDCRSLADNKETVNTCMDYVACSGTVACFGVPDDAIYDTFEYSKFFRTSPTTVRLVIAVSIATSTS
jgi:hypothetical protein